MRADALRRRALHALQSHFAAADVAKTDSRSEGDDLRPAPGTRRTGFTCISPHVRLTGSFLRIASVEAEGKSYPYDALLIATGGRPNPLREAGCVRALSNLFPFQYLDDTRAISEGIDRSSRLRRDRRLVHRVRTRRSLRIAGHPDALVDARSARASSCHRRGGRRAVARSGGPLTACICTTARKLRSSIRSNGVISESAHEQGQRD